MLILTLTLSFFSILLYNNFSLRLQEGIKDLLFSKAEGISDSIDTYWETEKLDAIEEGAKAEVFSKINNANFIKIAQRWVKEKSSDPELLNIVVQIFDVNGNNIASSKNEPHLAVPDREIFNSIVLGGNYHLYNVNVNSPLGKPAMYRVLTKPVIESNKVAYIIQVAIPLNLINSVLNNLIAILFLLLPISVLLTGMAGAFLVKITLSPVDNMIKTIHQITAESLELRIDIPRTKDEIQRLAATFNDMLARLDESFSSQKQFIQDVSHEFKTPLTILKGELETTLRKIRSAQEYESVLYSSLEEINKISTITDNLLVLARLDNKEFRPEFKSLDLNLLIQTVVSDIRILAEPKNITVDFLTPEKIVLNADREQLRQLFLNLLDNAIKYTPDNGRVTINLHKDAGFAKVELSDTGIGIPETELPYIFNRFYRVDKSRSSTGFGLGLSIARSIAELHEGKIKVESQLGRGTTFSVLLPLAHS